MKEINIFLPEGLLLNNDDAFRKFGMASLLFRHINIPDPFVAKVLAMRFPHITIHVLNRGQVTYHVDEIKVARIYPEGNLTNHVGIAYRFCRSGERQWQLGVGNAGFHVWKETSAESIRLVEPPLDLVHSMFNPRFVTITDAVSNISSGAIQSAAINKWFWVRGLKDKKNTTPKLVLYRKHIPVGLFTSPNKESFYLQGGCEIFRDDINELLEKNG